MHFSQQVLNSSIYVFSSRLMPYCWHVSFVQNFVLFLVEINYESYDKYEARDSQKVNLIIILAKNPWKEDTTEVSILGVGGKTPEQHSRENPRSQVETENPIHSVPPAHPNPGPRGGRPGKIPLTPTRPTKYCVHMQ